MTGLFHKAILQSGCALNYWTRGRTDNGIPLAKLLGHDPKSEAEALEYLREADLKDLLTAQERLPDVRNECELFKFKAIERQSFQA